MFSRRLVESLNHGLHTESSVVEDDSLYQSSLRDRRGRDRMVAGFTTTCAISAYHN